MRKNVTLFPRNLTLYYIFLTFNDPKEALKNTFGKRENAGNQHFLLFPLRFQNYQREKLSFL